MSCERQQSSLSCPDSAMSEDVELSSQEDEEEGVHVVCMYPIEWYENSQ